MNRSRHDEICRSFVRLWNSKAECWSAWKHLKTTKLSNQPLQVFRTSPWTHTLPQRTNETLKKGFLAKTPMRKLEKCIRKLLFILFALPRWKSLRRYGQQPLLSDSSPNACATGAHGALRQSARRLGGNSPEIVPQWRVPLAFPRHMNAMNAENWSWTAIEH